MRKLMLAVVLAASLSACAPKKEDIIYDIEAFGFSDVVIGKWTTWSCGRDDSWGYYFTATNPAGRQIKGVVCGGLNKGSTVRIRH